MSRRGVGRRRTAHGFSPRSLGNGLRLWLDASVGVLPGNTFTWSDQSGYGNDATQSTAGLQPTFNAASSNWNGRPCVTLDPANSQYLKCDGIGALVASADAAVTICCVFRFAAMETLTRTFVNWGAGSIGLNSWYFGTDTLSQVMEARIEDGAANTVTVLDDAPLDTNRHTSVTVAGGGLISSFQDGVPLFLGQAFSVNALATTTCTLGNIREVAATRGMRGDFAEICILNRALSSSEINALIAYERSKWGT